MTIINIPVAKIGQSIDVDTDRLTTGEIGVFDSIFAASPRLAYVIRYGLTQTLNDAHAASKYDSNAASAIVDAANIMALVQKKLDAVYAGTVAVRVGGVAADPVARMMSKLARAVLSKKAFIVGGKTVKYGKLEKDMRERVVAKYIAANDDSLRADAVAEIARLAALATATGDVGEAIDVDALIALDVPDDVDHDGNESPDAGDTESDAADATPAE